MNHVSHFDRRSAAQRLSRALIRSGCILFRKDEPFRLPSGWASPCYVDCRRLLAFPRIREELIALAVDYLQANGLVEGLSSITGAETSGIPWAAWVAARLDLPLQFVRKRARTTTIERQVCGSPAAAERTLLIDDLMASGVSKARFVSYLRADGLLLKDIFVLFDYAVFPTESLLPPADVKVHSLATWLDVLAELVDGQGAKSLGNDVTTQLKSFLDNPTDWSSRHGGISILHL